MGKLIVTNIISLDGNYEGPGKNVMTLPMDPAFDAYNLERIEAAAAVLLGGNSYRFFGGFWPGMVDHPAASETNREFARRYNQIPKVAVSSRLGDDDAPDARKATSRFITSNTYEAVAKLKQETAGEIVMFASRQLWNDLLVHGLVDELHFVVGNVVLGEGTPVFVKTIAYSDPTTTLALAASRKLDGSNNHLVIYKVVSAGRTA